MNYTPALLFAASFAVVFSLGLQQINVERRSMLAAALTSPLIGISSIVLYKVLPGPTAWLDLVAYLAGGMAGIVASMWLHPLMLRLWVRLFGPPAPRPEDAEDAELFASWNRSMEERRLEERVLAAEIADESSRSDLACFCTFTVTNGEKWYDTTDTGFAEHMRESVDKALRYLDLRGHITRHPHNPQLVRLAA